MQLSSVRSASVSHSVLRPLASASPHIASPLRLGASLPNRTNNHPMASAGSDSLHILLRPNTSSPVSGAFVKKLDEGWQSLPSVVRKSLAENGWQIHTARFLTEAAPFLKKLSPTGGDAGTVADNRSGVCIKPHIYLSEAVWLPKPKESSVLGKAKMANILQQVMPPEESEKGTLFKKIGVDRTVRHETGHAVDILLHRPTVSERFEKAYMKDYNALSDEAKEELHYFIQPGKDGKPSDTGYREAFADAFAALYGGGCNETGHFKKHFPNVVAYVKETIQEWESRNGRLPSAWDNGRPRFLQFA